MTSSLLCLLALIAVPLSGAGSAEPPDLTPEEEARMVERLFEDVETSNNGDSSSSSSSSSDGEGNPNPPAEDPAPQEEVPVIADETPPEDRVDTILRAASPVDQRTVYLWTFPHTEGQGRAAPADFTRKTFAAAVIEVDVGVPLELGLPVISPLSNPGVCRGGSRRERALAGIRAQW